VKKIEERKLVKDIAFVYLGKVKIKKLVI